ncbi:MAG TPA: EF-P lysine aminoacylase EpmA [Gammaproteobacteria bacterium]|nr:EF-P lysine aminoacylase EpmA [Gammaproteobacteria bacterium]
MTDWRPTADLDRLRRRAELLNAIRDFFRVRNVLEVDTPVLSAAAATDPALASLRTRYTGPGAPRGTTLYLHTSPELAMKRLLAAGSGPIYQVCKVFRDGERGGRHNPEFTLLEWYRPGFDHHRLMDEVEALLGAVTPRPLPAAARWAYRDLFIAVAGVDPFAAAVPELVRCLDRHGVAPPPHMPDTDRDPWLDLLLTHVVEPRLGPAPVFVYDYPATQAALARLRPGDPPVAERFELYMDGMELANGFHELADAAEQRRRLEHDMARRRAAGVPESPVDERFLAALEHGLPDCAGVALGVDRLAMCAAGVSSIDQVIAFPVDRA